MTQLIDVPIPDIVDRMHAHRAMAWQHSEEVADRIRDENPSARCQDMPDELRDALGEAFRHGMQTGHSLGRASGRVGAWDEAIDAVMAVTQEAAS